jgi:hypothetical protein
MNHFLRAIVTLLLALPAFAGDSIHLQRTLEQKEEEIRQLRARVAVVERAAARQDPGQARSSTLLYRKRTDMNTMQVFRPRLRLSRQMSDPGTRFPHSPEITGDAAEAGLRLRLERSIELRRHE